MVVDVKWHHVLVNAIGTTDPDMTRDAAVDCLIVSDGDAVSAPPGSTCRT